MSVARSLWLVRPEGASAVPPEEPLLGLPMIRRTVLAATKAGFERIVVEGATPDSGLGRALEATPAELVAPGAAIPPGAAVVPWNRVLRTSEVRELLTGGPPGELGVAVDTAADRRRAERWLLSGLVKDTEGFMSRHVERKISLAISRRLAATRISPNAMTLVSVAIGLLGAPFFLSPRPALQTTGALLFLWHSILDGCDGELARLKFQESRFGGVLDFWGDNVVHSAVFACIGLGWSRGAGASFPLVLGALAVAGTLASAWFVYRTTMMRSKQGPLFTSVAAGDSTASRVADALSRRDFIWLVLLLSLFGKAAGFLVLAAIGAPIFFLVLVALSRRGPERKTV
ncbi:MAG TPA: CDP-alcohol phosphatidyltransferase family protein [Thermoanaerobaculia bacterium]|nr:CDP-alcohol phosphatidyltransferase family protein [Thermoanaerobaculia bacterium]